MFKCIKVLINFAAMFKNTLYILVIIGILIVTGCSKFNQVVKNGTPEEKYSAADEYYKKGDYYHALQLYEELIVIYRGNAKIKELYFNYAYAHYYEKDLDLASYHFKYYAKTFPHDDKAQEALYMSAYCKYLMSPKHSLDQSSTKTAISELQSFINLYPESERVKDANKIIDELRLKLIQKNFDIAKLYYQTEYYLPAITALEQHVKDYPSTPFYEESLYLIIKANYDYAKKSVENKQYERYNNVVIAYNNYYSKFPDGEHSKDAMKIMRNAKSKLSTLKNI